MRGVLLVAVLLSALVAAGAAGASRAPSYLERVTIMDSFNIPGRAWPSRCVRILVSTADPRWALVTSPAHPPAACVRAGEAGNGFVLFTRTSRVSLHWRNVYEGDTTPCLLPRAVRRDLLQSTACS